MSKDGSQRQSPYSPFPFGSPVGTRHNPGTNSASANSSLQVSTVSGVTSPGQIKSLNNSLYMRGRVRAQEAYGGPVMFGGQTSSLRKNRLVAASPYAASAMASRKPHQRPIFDNSTVAQPSNRHGSSAANTPSPAPSPSPSSTTSDNGAMSSTARLIFDTLEKMSTPIRDAQKLIPSVSASPPRAEKRRLIAEQLDWSQSAMKRRRPQLGGSGGQGLDQLNGPPLRTIFSPVPASSPRPPRSSAVKSARMTPASSGGPVQPQRRNLGDTLMAAESRIPAPPQSFKPDLNKKSVMMYNQTGKQDDLSGGGKMRTKLGESLHQKSATSSNDIMSNSADPVNAFLAAHNAKLPLKTMPVFDFCSSDKTSTSTVSSPPKPALAHKLAPLSPAISTRTASTATTLPLFPSQDIASDDTDTDDPQETFSFQFSYPSPVKGISSQDDVVSNGIVYSFCQPKEVVTPSIRPSLDSPQTSESLILDRSPLKNHTISAATTLPDLTMRSSPNVAVPAKSLKVGSVMDILKRDHSLPDVTASTGLQKS